MSAFDTSGTTPGILATSTTLVVADRRAVVAFSIRDGAERWRVPATPNGWTSSIAGRLVGNDLLVVLGPGEIGAVDIDSGAMRWRNRVANDGVCQSLGAPAVFGQQAYLSRACTFRNSAEVIALDALTGAVLWRYEIDGAADDAIHAPALTTADMIVIEATIRTSAGTRESAYVALDRATGTLRWRTTLPIHPQNEWAALSSPVLVDGVIVVEEAGRPDARRAAGLDARTGELRWQSDVAEAEVVGDVVVGADANRLSAKGAPAVLAVSASTGTQLWRIDDVVQPSRPLGAMTPVVVTSGELAMGVDARTGTTLWRAPLEPFDFSNPPLLISAQSIDDRTMIVVRTSTGMQNRSLTVAQPVDIATGAAGRAAEFDLFTLATTVTADGTVLMVGRFNRPERPSSYAGSAVAMKHSRT